jgi:hypothetical protein
MKPPSPLLDFNGVAKLLNVHPRQAEELYRQGAFPGIRLSHKYLRFDAAEVLRSIKQKKTKSYDERITA